MPIYINNTARTVRFRGLELEPGASGAPLPNQYLSPAELAQCGLTLLHNDTAPWRTLHQVAPPVAIASGLSSFIQVEIINDTGALIIVIVNGDADNPKVILDDRLEIITMNREADSLAITGAGTGNVYVYGLYKRNT
jgi:hypothetical protein